MTTVNNMWRGGQWWSKERGRGRKRKRECVVNREVTKVKKLLERSDGIVRWQVLLLSLKLGEGERWMGFLEECVVCNTKDKWGREKKSESKELFVGKDETRNILYET